MIPHRNVEDYKQQEPLQFGKKIKLRYLNAKAEVPFDGFKPDVCIFRERENILIEIAVTHYVDAGKIWQNKNGADANSRNQHC